MKTSITIISVNKSGKSAFATVQNEQGFVLTDVCAGNIRLPEGAEVKAGDVQDITGATVELVVSEDAGYEGIPWVKLS